MYTDLDSNADQSDPRCHDATSISLWTLFQVLTACCIFLAILRFSPTLALVATVVFGPAVIRTAWVSEIHRRQKKSFRWPERIRFFGGSVAVVLMTLSAGLLSFVVISAGFGVLGLVFGGAITSFEMGYEAAVMATVGGMVWGMAVGFLAMCFVVCKLWHPMPT